MDKIQNVKQLEGFQEELRALYDRQSVHVLVIESDNLSRRIVESVFQKLGFTNVVKMESGKEFLNELVNSSDTLVIWYEFKQGDPVLEILLKIIPTISQDKSVIAMFSGSADDKETLAKVLQYNHKNIFIKPLDTKTVESKLLEFFK